MCSTPYSLTTRDGVYSSIRDFMDELMLGARAGFDGIAVTEHGQSSYDMMPNPDLVASALAYMTEAEGLDVAIFPMGRSLGKAREPIRVAEEYAFIDVLSGGRLVAGFPIGLHYDASINNGVPPIEIRPRFDENLELLLRAWRNRSRSRTTAGSASTPRSTSGPGRCSRRRRCGSPASVTRARCRCAWSATSGSTT